jgi:hypothetical protein
MTASYIQLLADGPGKKVRSRYLTQGSDIVYEQYVQALRHPRTLTTKYWYHSGALVVGASADGANVGRVYIENDPDSTVLIALLRARFTSQQGSALVTATSPRITLRRFTFTGNTPSGATLTGALIDSTLPAKNSNWDVRTAATGMVITEAGDICSFFPVTAITAVGACAASVDNLSPAETPSNDVEGFFCAYRKNGKR